MRAGPESSRRWFASVLPGFLLIAFPLPASFAQKSTGGDSPGPTVVPVVGCPSDGQAGPGESPPHGSRATNLTAAEARQLSYYTSAQLAVGVLAPRGWHCFAAYGSSGSSLFVTPHPIGSAAALRSRISGPVVHLSYVSGDTSGSMIVAGIIARVFPSHNAYVAGVAASFDTSFPSDPFPADTLLYKSENTVEYRTPRQTEGLGTQSRLKADGNPIHGVAILVGHTPDLLRLSVRLPQESDRLSAAIVSQAESDAALLNK